MSRKNIQQHHLQILVFFVGLTIWFTPAPDGLTTQAWHLFAIFISAIFAVILIAMPIFTSILIALSIAV